MWKVRIKNLETNQVRFYKFDRKYKAIEYAEKHVKIFGNKYDIEIINERKV